MLSSVINMFYGSGSKILTDEYFYHQIEKTNLLQQSTKNCYIVQLRKITGEFFIKPVTIDWVMKHPSEFTEVCRQYGKIRHFKTDTTARYTAPILFLIEYNHKELQENNIHLKYDWLNVRENLKGPDDFNPIEGVEMTERQKKAFIPFHEICQIRDQLPEGSMERLLISLYTMMDPVRADFHDIEIYEKKPEKNEGNYMVLGHTNKLFLNDYKTALRYREIILDLPDDLVEKIKISLIQYPRKYLFVDRFGNPYNSNSFNKWANTLLKRTFNNPYFSLTMFRHIYLSSPEVNIKDKTLPERKEIAKNMGHSLDMQNQYVFKEKIKIKNKK